MEIRRKDTNKNQVEINTNEDDRENIREAWFTKNQQRILEAWGKAEPNWHNILVKNPDLGFKSAKDIRDWTLAKIPAKITGQDLEQTT